jgi:hypothetical protein
MVNGRVFEPLLMRYVYPGITWVHLYELGRGDPVARNTFRVFRTTMGALGFEARKDLWRARLIASDGELRYERKLCHSCVLWTYFVTGGFVCD